VSTCGHRTGELKWTTEKKVKYCSADRAALERWDAEVGGESLVPCRHCMD